MEVELLCGVPECRNPIPKGDEYYLLGGGKVVNCMSCVMNRKLRLPIYARGSITQVVDTYETERGWHRITKQCPKILKSNVY
jgi:hypothetical protein